MPLSGKWAVLGCIPMREMRPRMQAIWRKRVLWRRHVFGVHEPPPAPGTSLLRPGIIEQCRIFRRAADARPGPCPGPWRRIFERSRILQRQHVTDGALRHAGRRPAEHGGVRNPGGRGLLAFTKDNCRAPWRRMGKMKDQGHAQVEWGRMMKVQSRSQLHYVADSQCSRGHTVSLCWSDGMQGNIICATVRVDGSPQPSR